MLHTIIIRADASNEIGIGHVMRCIALAHQLKRQNITALFCCRKTAGHLIDHITDNGFDVLHLSDTITDESDDARALIDQFQRTNITPDALLIDHYGLSSNYERMMRKHIPHIVAIDDLPTRSHEVDILIDTTLNRQAAEYASYVPDSCTGLTGIGYSLIRPDVLAQAEHPPTTIERRIVVTMGGADPLNLSQQLAEQLAKDDSLDVHIIIGPSNQHTDWYISDTLPSNLTIHQSPPDFSALLASAALVVTAGGSTCWEICFLNKPMVIVPFTDNHKDITIALEQAGAALVSSGDDILVRCQHVLSSPETQQRMQVAQSSLVDGQGAERIVHTMLEQFA